MLREARRAIDHRFTDFEARQANEQVRLMERVENLQAAVGDVWRSMGELFDVIIQHWGQEKPQQQQVAARGDCCPRCCGSWTMMPAAAPPAPTVAPLLQDESSDAYRRLKGTIRKYLEDEQKAREKSIEGLKMQVTKLESKLDAISLEWECQVKRQSSRPAYNSDQFQADHIALIRKMIGEHEGIVDSKVQAAIRPIVDHVQKSTRTHQELLEGQLDDLRQKTRRDREADCKKYDSLLDQLRGQLSGLQSSTRNAFHLLSHKMNVSAPPF